MTEPEAGAVVEMMNTCEDPPVVEIRMPLGTATGVHKPEPTEELQNSVYGSCEEAAEAGGAAGAGKPGRRAGIPGGDGAISPGRGRGWCSM